MLLFHYLNPPFPFYVFFIFSKKTFSRRHCCSTAATTNTSNNNRQLPNTIAEVPHKVRDPRASQLASYLRDSTTQQPAAMRFAATTTTCSHASSRHKTPSTARSSHLMHDPITLASFRSSPFVKHQCLLHPNKSRAFRAINLPVFTRCFPVGYFLVCKEVHSTQAEDGELTSAHRPLLVIPLLIINPRASLLTPSTPTPLDLGSMPPLTSTMSHPFAIFPRNVGVSTFPSLRSLHENLQLPFFFPLQATSAATVAHPFPAGASGDSGNAGMAFNWLSDIEEGRIDSGGATVGAGSGRVAMGNRT